MTPKVYYLRFGSGDCRTFTGLAPTFLIFKKFDGSAVTAPGITEPIASSGIYQFTVAPSFSIAFLAYGNTTSIPAASAYVVGNLDPIDANDDAISILGTTLIAQGATIVAMGNTLAAIGSTSGAAGATILAMGNTLADISTRLGSTASSFGSTSVDPGTIFGYLKRAQEFSEGNASYLKSSGAWALYSRGSSTLLVSKALSNSATGVTKI